MKSLNFIQYFLFIGIICLEGFLSLRNDRHEYKIKDTLANISIAALNWIINLFLKGFIFLGLVKLQELSLFKFETSFLVYLVLFLLSDLIHYGFHYLEHKSRFFWATHSIHHSSDSYNFSIALRTAHTNTLYRSMYEIPLCILGFDAYAVVMTHSFMLLYGFFQHTELVKKLGWLEYFLNTPSHHRVHHASNEKYLDKNFGGVLIIWDKLFGTFQPEEEQPTYGLVKPIKTHNPLKIVFNEWIVMAKDVLKSKSWKERVFYIFYKPGWKPVEKKKNVLAKLTENKTNDCKKCPRCTANSLGPWKDLAESINFPSQKISLKIN